jgi:tetratricopeptide (TPR) repeat protein
LLLLVLAALIPAARAQSPPPGPAGADLATARGLLSEGKLDAAEQILRRRIETPPTVADAHFLLGQLLFRRIQERAQGHNGGHSESTRALAKESLAQYAAGARLRDLDAFDLKIAALDQALLGDLVSADALLTRSVAANPADADAWYYLGRTKYNESRFAEAADAFLRCLALEPRNVKAQDNLGLSYAGLGRTDAAIAAYETAIAWQADATEKNPGPFLDLGALLLEQNRPREAIPHLREAAALAPQDPRAHEHLGKAYLRLERHAEAQAALEQAIALAPDSAPLHFVLGQLYRKTGQLEKARLAFERAATLNGSHSTR